VTGWFEVTEEANMRYIIKTLWILLAVIIVLTVLGIPVMFDLRIARSLPAYLVYIFTVGSFTGSLIAAYTEDIFITISNKYCTGFFHKYTGCKCKRCGKIRYGHHDWDRCICSCCGTERHIKENKICRCHICTAKLPCDYTIINSVITTESTGLGFHNCFAHETYITRNTLTYRCTHCGNEIDEVKEVDVKYEMH